MLPMKTMTHFFDLPWQFGGMVFTLGCVCLALLGLWIISKLSTPEMRRKHHDVVGFTFGIVGVVYAVLLGFTVVNVNDRFNQIQMNLIEESALMLKLYRDAEGLPLENRDKVRGTIRDYANTVYGEELQAQEEGRESIKAYGHLAALWAELYRTKPESETEKVWFAETVHQMNQLANYRVLRIFNMTQSLGEMMWALLVGGALITIFFMYFFYVESYLIHALLTAFLTGTIAFMLFLILNLDTAYSGYARVDVEEIAKTIQRFEQI